MGNFLKVRQIEIFVIVIIIALIGIIYAFTREAKAPTSQTQQSMQQP